MGRRCAGRVGRKKYIRNRENKSFRRIGDKREDEKRASEKACKLGIEHQASRPLFMRRFASKILFR